MGRVQTIAPQQCMGPIVKGIFFQDLVVDKSGF
jgi:hypothetical protein